jgi:hypothetical protein
MLINKITFAQLEKEVSRSGKSSLEYLTLDVGKVHVVAITRDQCPDCERQEPRMEKLAKGIMEKHGKTVVFTQIRVRDPTEKDGEVLRSKEILGHYFFPTNLILLRTKDRGALEFYKNVSPRMSELKRSIDVAVEMAGMLKNR